jgi:hypothetical protein
MLDAGLKMPMLDETTDTGYWIKPKCRDWMLDGLYPASSIQYPVSTILSSIIRPKAVNLVLLKKLAINSQTWLLSI